jgi:Rieske Fe-S protein
MWDWQGSGFHFMEVKHIIIMEQQSIFSLETAVGRREFLKRTGIALTGLTLAGTLAEILASCANLTGPGVTHGSTTVNVASLGSDGSYLVDSSVKPDGTPILVIRQNATTYVALSMYCTHEGCQVDPPKNGSIYCACHGSRFDLNGNVLVGPAPSALTKYTTQLNAETKVLTVSY